jgi:hypothetical protein
MLACETAFRGPSLSAEFHNLWHTRQLPTKAKLFPRVRFVVAAEDAIREFLHYARQLRFGLRYLLAPPSGILGRWQDHEKHGKGDKVKLKSRQPSDYHVSILDVVGTSTTDDEIFKLSSVIISYSK